MGSHIQKSQESCFISYANGHLKRLYTLKSIQCDESIRGTDKRERVQHDSRYLGD